MQALLGERRASLPSTAGADEPPKEPSPTKGFEEHPELGECRICQEDDLVSNMESPCDCDGTVKYAHHECIQMWVNEKGNLKCEICGGSFKGSYTVPPPPQLRELHLEEALAAFPLLRPFRQRLLLHSSLELTGNLEVGEDETPSDFTSTRQLSVTYCFAILLMVLGMFTIHHTFNDLQGDTDGGQQGSSGHENISMHHSGAQHPSAPAAQHTQEDASMDLGVIVIWLLLRLAMVALPLILMMRVLSLMHHSNRRETHAPPNEFDVARFLQQLEEGGAARTQHPMYQRGGIAQTGSLSDLPLRSLSSSLQGSGTSTPSR